MSDEKSNEKSNWFRGIQITSVNALIAVSILFSVLIILTPKVNKIVSNTIEKNQVSSMKEVSYKEVISNKGLYIECVESLPIEKVSECENYVNASTKKEASKKSLKIVVKEPTRVDLALNKLLDSDIFIKSIYILILFAIIVQLNMYYIIKSNVKDSLYQYVVRNKFYLSEYAINSPLTAGVIATLYSFSLFALNSSSGANLMEVFKISVFDAIATTIVGGTAYILNLWLNSTIQQAEV